ncbi:MAG: carboxymuconolactone decarboxylase family protein [Myxococcota bacterium]
MQERCPTVPLVSDEEANEDLKEVYRMCREAMGGVPHLARVIANCEGALTPFLELAGAIGKEYAVPNRLKQLAVIRTAELNGCGYCRSIHVPKGREMGIEEEKLEGVAADEVAHDVFAPEERLVLRMTDEMTGMVGARPETVAEVKERWGATGAVELMMVISFYNLLNRLAESAQVPLEG